MVWTADSIAGLPCQVSLPADYDPGRRYPLVVSLHGSGERGTDNRAQLRNGLGDLAGFVRGPNVDAAIVVAPQIPTDQTFGGSWYGGESAAQRQVADLVRDLQGRHSIDESHVIGVGFSMGAIGLWDLLVRQPGLFARAILIAGDLDDATADALVDAPIWAIHGDRDIIVPPVNFRRFADKARASGGRARTTEVEGMGHDVWRYAFGHEPLWRWALDPVSSP